MRFNRFALVAGVLALGVAACGDDVQVVEPTPPPPPPPPALSASMAPASAEVMVGSSVVFAVNVSGGAAGEASSWSCASSNTGIATVSVTSAGCQATGVAAGGVTITATVSKGNETANVGSQLTVTAPAAPPPFEASIAPASQSVAVGSSVVFAVNTSGGYTAMMGDMMMAASWTCASSDPAIATVETTDAGCQATGVSGGDVTINVAATDGHATVNLVAQLTVTTDPVDPVQPFSASMAPESATVAVGSNAVFAINTSGGAADATASWTCSSSDDAIATAETTDAGCQATGVAAGGVTINAAVTKGEDSASLAAQLTVTAPDVGEPAFVFITNPTDGTSLAGDVSVTISVERGDQVLEGLSLLVDDEEVAHQSFGGAHMSPADGPAEQAPLNFTLSFDSGEYDRETGAVTYLNGDHTISAELEIVVDMADGTHGHASVLSNNVSVEFDNDDDVHVSIAGLGDGVMNPTTGDLWYGGPDAAPEITAVPVIYSSGPVTALTLLEFCGEDAMTDDEAPFVFMPDCDETVNEGQLEFNVGGMAGGKLNWDFEGPDAPHFSPNPNMREDGWVNASVDFLGAQKSSNKDGWLVYNEDDSGVGGYQPVLRWSSTTPSIVDGARAATPNAIPTEPTKKDAACVIATAVDLLGNESKLPSAGKPCVSAADYATTEGTGDDATTTYAAGLRAGLDVSAPTITFSAASPKANDTSLKNFQVQVADTGGSTGKSGLHSDPVLAKIEVRNAKNEIICGDQKDVGGPVGEKKITGECALTGTGLDFNDPLATTMGLVGPETHGYYTFTAVSRDKAGNRSEEAVRTALEDNSPPKAGVIVGGYSKGAYTLTATITDDLSIKSYWAESRFADAVAFGIGTSAAPLILPKEGSTAVDGYDSAEFTQSLLETVTVHTFRAVQTAVGTFAQLASIGIKAVDQAGGNTMNLGIADISTATLGDVDGFGQNATAGTFAADAAAVTYERDEVFQTFSADETSVDGSTVELRAEIEGTAEYAAAVAAVAGVDANGDGDFTDDGDTAPVAAVDGTEGLVNNPVSRVDFYAAVALKNVGTTTTDRVPPVADGTPGTIGDTEALVFLGSASGAGAVDSVDDQGTTDTADDVNMRKYVWGIDLSGAEVLAAVGKSKSEEHDVQIIAVAVNSDGVAIFDSVSEADAQTTLVEITVER